MTQGPPDSTDPRIKALLEKRLAREERTKERQEKQLQRLIARRKDKRIKHQQKIDEERDDYLTHYIITPSTQMEVTTAIPPHEPPHNPPHADSRKEQHLAHRERVNDNRIQFRFNCTPESWQHLIDITRPAAIAAVIQDSNAQIAGLLLEAGSAPKEQQQSLYTRIMYLRNVRHTRITGSRSVSLGLATLLQQGHLVGRDTRPDYIKREDINVLKFHLKNPSAPWSVNNSPIWSDPDPGYDRDGNAIIPEPHTLLLHRDTYDHLLQIAKDLHIVGKRGWMTPDARVRQVLEATALGWIS